MKAHLCQLWVSKHFPLSVWGRWKYLVHDMGVFEHLTQWKCTQILSSWELKGHLYQLKGKRYASKNCCFTVKRHHPLQEKVTGDWSKYSLLYSLFQVKVPSEKHPLCRCSASVIYGCSSQVKAALYCYFSVVFQKDEREQQWWEMLWALHLTQNTAQSDNTLTTLVDWSLTPPLSWVLCSLRHVFPVIFLVCMHIL